jgi:hypothetical protein
MDYLVTWNCAHLANGETIRRLANKRLLVGFASGVTKIYDCTPLLKHEPFKPLSNDAVFRSVHADPHGYGVVWTDDLDLAESELWLNGEVVEPGDPVDH